MSVKKKPSVPTNIEISNTVGEYMPHDDGRKSRWRLVTMITNLSSHMPMLTMIEITNSQNSLSLNRLNQRSWIDAPLHKSSSQYIYQYGPSHMRFLSMNHSNCDAPYQPKNASI